MSGGERASMRNKSKKRGKMGKTRGREKNKKCFQLKNSMRTKETEFNRLRVVRSPSQIPTNR